MLLEFERAKLSSKRATRSSSGGQAHEVVVRTAGRKNRGYVNDDVLGLILCRNEQNTQKSDETEILDARCGEGAI